MRFTDESRPIIRDNQPKPPPDTSWIKGTSVGDDGCLQWHPDGADVGDRWLGLSIGVVGSILLMVLCLIFGSMVPSESTPPVPPHTPTTYGPPPTVVP